MIEIIPNWHPIFVHFTVALILTSGGLQLALFFSKSPDRMAVMKAAQRWLVALAAIAVMATLASGFLAYYSVDHDTPSHVAMTLHRNWAIATASLFLLGAGLLFWGAGAAQRAAGAAFVLAMLLVSVTGLKGADLVFRFGLGVMSLPQVSGEGHAHEHEGGGHEHGPAATPETPAEGHDHGDTEGHDHDEGPGQETPADVAGPFVGLKGSAAIAAATFHAALATGDTAVVLNLLADAVIIFEGGGVERSAQEYAGHHMNADIEFLRQMNITLLEHQVVETGDMAVSLGRSRVQGVLGEREIDLESMETLVLQRVDGQWRIIHIHWSSG